MQNTTMYVVAKSVAKAWVKDAAHLRHETVLEAPSMPLQR